MSELTPWQKEIAEVLIQSVPRIMLIGRGRRAGWTTMLAEVEKALKWRGPGPLALWDGRELDPDTWTIRESKPT